MENIENHIMMGKLCRVCLLENNENESHPIFSKYLNLNIYNLLTKIVDIQLSESEAPNTICKRCLQFLLKLRNFQELCLKSDKAIRDYYSDLKLRKAEEVKFVNIKVEDVEGNNQHHDDDLSQNTNKNIDFVDNLSEGEDSNEQNVVTFLKQDDLDEDLSENENRTEKSTKNKKLYIYYLKKDESGREVFACNLCPRRFNYIIDFKNHMPSHGAYPFVCNECNKAFKKYQSVLVHSKRHTCTIRFKCELCEKSYVEKASLKVHMRAHRNERPFLCPTCGKAFRQNSELKTHLGIHTGEMKFMCNYCGARLRSRGSFNVHLRSHTGERPFLCAECPKTFTSSYRLRMHKIIHTGLKPYTCTICQKSFNRKFTLRVHVKSHSKERPHVCKVCDKGFTQAHSLRSHLLIHAREKSKLEFFN